MTASPLRLAFMGTPEFAAVALRALETAGHDIVVVYAQPPKPAGRGHRVQPTPVHKLADELNLAVRTPKTLRDPVEQISFKNLNLDVAVVAAYGLILPEPILTAPRLGCINIHASLLPRWRGAAPIQRAMLAGDAVTGITTMQMDVGLDTGPMFLQDRVAINEKTTAASLTNDLAQMGGRLVLETLERLASHSLTSTPQPADGMSYAAKLTREDGRIDWTQSAATIERMTRALQPWPGCFFMFKNEMIKVLAVEIVAQSGTPGTLLSDNCTIACKDKAIKITMVQRPGKAPTDGASFLRGARLAPGSIL